MEGQCLFKGEIIASACLYSHSFAQACLLQGNVSQVCNLVHEHLVYQFSPVMCYLTQSSSSKESNYTMKKKISRLTDFQTNESLDTITGIMIVRDIWAMDSFGHIA